MAINPVEARASFLTLLSTHLALEQNKALFAKTQVGQDSPGDPRSRLAKLQFLSKAAFFTK